MPRLGKRRRLGKNIYEDSGSIEASVRVTVHGERLCRYKRYPKGTELKQIRPWQRETAQELRKLKGPASVDTIAADVERYLPLVREELASFSDRERHLRAWIPVVGHLKADALETSAIDTQLRKWRNIDRLSASTVNQRRDALSDLFVKLYPTLTNPVKGAVWFARKKSAPKGIDRGRIARVLEHMDPDRKTRWRLSLMHWTGMRPSQMGRLTGPDDFYLDDRAFMVEVNGAPRRVPAVLVPSGKGGDLVMFPLTPEGEEVARQFIRVDAFWRPPATPKAGSRKPRQTWSCPSAYKRIVAAAKAIDEPPFTVYAIKHSFASTLLQTGTDASIIQEMLGHADIKSTLVYARGVRGTHVQALDRLRQDDARRATPPTAQPAAESLAVPTGGSDGTTAEPSA
jgi:integrase